MQFYFQNSFHDTGENTYSRNAKQHGLGFMIREPTNSRGYIAIRPEDIVISSEALSSSMRNSFRGVVSGIFDQGFYYEVHLRVGAVTFKSLITKTSLFELKLHEGAEVFLSFKASAVHSF